jgi:hypothetical protein
LRSSSVSIGGMRDDIIRFRALVCRQDRRILESARMVQWGKLSTEMTARRELDFVSRDRRLVLSVASQQLISSLLHTAESIRVDLQRESTRQNKSSLMRLNFLSTACHARHLIAHWSWCYNLRPSFVFQFFTKPFG